MGDIFGQVGVDDDVHAAGAAHLAFHWKSDHLGDAAAPAVGADQVLGADAIDLAGDAVLDDSGDAVIVLLEIHELRIEAQRGAAPPGGLDQDRLEQILRQVANAGRAREFVVGPARGVIAPRI